MVVRRANGLELSAINKASRSYLINVIRSKSYLYFTTSRNTWCCSRKFDIAQQCRAQESTSTRRLHFKFSNFEFWTFELLSFTSPPNTVRSPHSDSSPYNPITLSRSLASDHIHSPFRVFLPSCDPLVFTHPWCYFRPCGTLSHVDPSRVTFLSFNSARLPLLIFRKFGNSFIVFKFYMYASSGGEGS